MGTADKRPGVNGQSLPTATGKTVKMINSDYKNGNLQAIKNNLIFFCEKGIQTIQYRLQCIHTTNKGSGSQ